MAFKLQQSERPKRLPARSPEPGAKRFRRQSPPARRFLAKAWLLAGPLHVQGLCEIIACYAQELEGVCTSLMPIPTDSSVTALAVLPDGTVASSSYDATVRVWDTKTSECVRVLKGQHLGLFENGEHGDYVHLKIEHLGAEKIMARLLRR